MAPIRITLDKSDALTIPAQPLTPAGFAPFGSVVQNPHPSVHPSPSLPATLTYDAVPANQGTAIKYQHLSRPLDLYHSAPSRVPSKPVLNLFVCAARPLRRRSPPPPPSSLSPTSSPSPSPSPSPSSPSSSPTSSKSTNPVAHLRPYNQTAAQYKSSAGLFPVAVLERHPFTTQTFILLAQGPAAPPCTYLVIVAPSLPSGPLDRDLPFPSFLSEECKKDTTTPARGVPDLRNLRAFIAGPGQGVTYGAGVWHAPMVALGPAGSAIEFAVTQFANGVAEEDCQEVVFGDRDGEGGIVVEVPGQVALSRL